MSIVVAAYEPGEGVWIGADTQATQNDFIAQTHLEKWVVNDYWGISITGYSRALDIVAQDADKILKPKSGAYDIANALYRNFQKFDFKDSLEGSVPGFGQWILLVNSRQIFSIGTDFSVTEAADGFYAEGSGCEYAWGVHYALRKKSAKIRVKTALEAACKYNIYCGGEIRMQLLGEDE